VTFRFPPIRSNECWKIGFIQACSYFIYLFPSNLIHLQGDYMLFENQYGDHG
jgi:hypothetical protein